MKAENLNKLQNIQKIKNFIYDPKLSNLNIYSKQFLGSILYSMYKDNNNSLCFAFGDLDKVRRINDIYSVQVGDQIIHDGLAKIKSLLPDQTLIARVAGDEFIFLTPNYTKKEMDNRIKEIRNSMDSDPSLLGLNITMSSIDSSIYSDFNDMYDFTELDVTKQKKHSAQRLLQNDIEENLKRKITNNFRNYFNYYRLNDKSPRNILPNEFYLGLRNNIFDIVINRLEKPDINMSLYSEKIKSSLNNESHYLKYFQLKEEIASRIFRTTVNTPSLSDLYKIDNKDLESVFIFLTRDPLTNQFSKQFFENDILPKITSRPEQNMSVTLFDLVHLKLSNDTINHNKTDEKIYELFNIITNKLNKSVEYSNSTRDTGNYLVSYGGKLISIESGESKLKSEDLELTLKKARKNQRILDIVYSTKNGKNTNLKDTIEDLKEDCDLQKSKLKINKITNPESIIPLDIALNDCISYYLDKFPDATTVKGKQKLIISLFEGMAQVVAERTPEQKSPNYNSKKKLIIQKPNDKSNDLER